MGVKIPFLLKIGKHILSIMAIKIQIFTYLGFGRYVHTAIIESKSLSLYVLSSFFPPLLPSTCYMMLMFFMAVSVSILSTKQNGFYCLIAS